MLISALAYIAFKFDIPRFTAVIFAVALLLRIIAVIEFKTPPESDFAVLLQASRDLLNGNLSFLDTDYFRLWSYQMGFVSFQSLLLKLWNSITILKIFNCIISSLTVCLVYLISSEFVSKKSAQAVTLVYCFFPFSVLYVTVLNNQLLSSFLIYCGIYVIISKKLCISSHLKYLICAVFLVFANIIRPESIIAVVSILIYLVLTAKNSFRKNLLDIFIVVATYFLLFKAASVLYKISGISPNGLTNNDPLWKFVLGFNHTSNGTYADSDTVYLNNPQIELEVIKSRVLVRPEALFKLFKNKISTFWGGSGISWSLHYALDKKIRIFGYEHNAYSLYLIAENACKSTRTLLYILSLIGVRSKLKDKNASDKILLFLNIVFVTFGVYLLIEVQARYAYNVHISVAVLAATGTDYIYNKLINGNKHKELIL